MAPVATSKPAPAPTADLKTQDAAVPEDKKAAILAMRPFDRLWRGDEAGKVKLEALPDFQGDKYAERQWVKEHMAAAFRFWGKKGYAEGAAGHITVRDPVRPGHYWMNPIAVAYSSMKASSLVLVTPTGHVHPDGAQLPINTAGFYIHSAIHGARPDVAAAAHCHSMHGKTWSVFGRGIELMTQDSCIFKDNLSVYKSFGGIVLAGEEGGRIAEALGPRNKAVILQNHGLLTLGTTVDEAVYLFFALEQACRVQLLAEAAAANGIPKRIIDDEDAEFTAATIRDPEVSYLAFRPEYELLKEETNGAFLQ